jgi:hypothetical protein
MLLKDQQKFTFWRRVLREISYSFVIGAVPTIFSSATASELSDMVKTLLTSPVLMGYYVAILGIFTVVTIISFQMRLRSPSHHRMMRELHAFFVNIGGSLLTAFRAALGAMVGFLLVWAYKDPGTMGVSSVFTTVKYASMTLSICVMLAWMDEILRNPHATSRYS